MQSDYVIKYNIIIIIINLSILDSENEHYSHGGSLYNGDTQVLYWADVSSEIAFVVPTMHRMRKEFDEFNQQESGNANFDV